MRTKSSVLTVVASLVSLSCAEPVLISGGDLPPDRQAQLECGGGISINEIDGAEMSGRAFILAPGTYSLDFTSQRDLKTTNSMLKGVIAQLDCKTEVSLQPGEIVTVSSRLRTGKDQVSPTGLRRGYNTEITLSSSLEGRTRTVETNRCRESTNCDKLDRSRVYGGSGICD